MALGEAYEKSVVFISGTMPGPPAITALRGTGFVVGVPSAHPEGVFLYIATAAHVVRPCSSTFVRVNRPDGSVEDLPVDRWIFHPFEDIAVTPVLGEDFGHSYGTAESFIGSARVDHHPAPGDDVFFAGLLGQVRSMGERNIPMVRSGSIGALYQEGVPMRLPDDTVLHVRGHLIDCRSFGGFSGSPCFVRFISGQGQTERLGLRYPIQSTLLLGMVGGHFDLKASVALPDQEEKFKVPVAAGIAVVYPAESIVNTLEEDELVAERADDNARIEKEMRERESEDAATADVAGEDQFARFQALAQRLVHVPKSELDQKRQDES